MYIVLALGSGPLLSTSKLVVPVRQVYIALVHIHETYVRSSTALIILHRLSDQNMQKMQKNTRIPSLKSVLYVVSIS